MSAAERASKTQVAIRIPHKLAEEIRQIATREGESRAAILRRLLKAGLAAEPVGAAAAKEA